MELFYNLEARSNGRVDFMDKTFVERSQNARDTLEVTDSILFVN